MKLDDWKSEVFDESFIKESQGQYDMISWMVHWCKNEGLILNLNGEVGFMRPCVGVISDSNYPEYMWYDGSFVRIDSNGDVWVPARAYHKHPCVAVLGTDDESVKQLYTWLRWFDENNFHYAMEKDTGRSQLEKILLGRFIHRMIKRG